jgi:hypothetical protein
MKFLVSVANGDIGGCFHIVCDGRDQLDRAAEILRGKGFKIPLDSATEVEVTRAPRTPTESQGAR